jgi:hypothetical protein
MAAAACSSGEAASPAPTLTLFPATLTVTPSPVMPSATRAALPGPDDIASATPEGAFTAEETPQLDPVAAELVRLAQRRLGEELDLPTRRLRVIEVRPLQWPDSSLGCPLPGQTYTPILIDGYRIVLGAGDNEYIFHSDFDRVIPCDSDKEQLPENS